MPCPGYSGGTVPVDTVHQKGLSGKAGGALTAREPTKKLLSEKLVERCPAGATLRSHILKSWWSTPCVLDLVIGFWLTNHTGNPAGIIDLRINGHGDTIYGIGRKTEPRYIEARPAARALRSQVAGQLPQAAGHGLRYTEGGNIWTINQRGIQGSGSQL